MLLDDIAGISELCMQHILLIDLYRRLAFQRMIISRIAFAPRQLVRRLSNIIDVQVLLLQALQLSMRLDSIDKL